MNKTNEYYFLEVQQLTHIILLVYIILVYELTEIITMEHLNPFILSKIVYGTMVYVIYMASLFSLNSSILLAVANIHIYTVYRYIHQLDTCESNIRAILGIRTPRRKIQLNHRK